VGFRGFTPVQKSWPLQHRVAGPTSAHVQFKEK
jgi:hypothetical protein